MTFEEVLPRLREGDVIFLDENGDKTFYRRWGDDIQSYYIDMQGVHYVRTPLLVSSEVFDGDWGITDDRTLDEHIRLGLRK